GKYRLAQFIVGGNDRSVWQFQQTLAESVVVAVDLPAVELPFDVHRHPVRQRTLAEILLQQIGLVLIEFPDRVDDLVQRRLHPISLEPFPFRWNRNGALSFVLTRFLYANRYPLRLKTL